ncbi:MAG TPA: LacI family DNA-binding transcriptional regulator, partial [Solirubrobacteraceae bacterium]|nr:LacI family DNA-binding transcriptional regulator [Solirubrobacteraceae bacterium]
MALVISLERSATLLLDKNPLKRIRFLIAAGSSASASNDKGFSVDATNETISASAGPRGGRRATMKQVAALAGVSLSTVSRVVNADPSVRSDLAERVQEAVVALGYRHNVT